MSTIYKYRVYCNDEGSDKYSWGDTEPTICPTNSSHTIDASKTRIVKTVKESLIKIDEGTDELSGLYRTSSYFMDIPEYKPVIGEITSAITTGDTVFDVSQGVIDNVNMDYYITANDGTTSGLLGKIFVIDDANNKIHVEGTGSPSDFSTSGTNIELNTTIREITHEYNVGVLSYSFLSDTTHHKDGAEVHVYPEKIIGALGANVSIGDTVLTVSSTVIENMKPGFMCILSAGGIDECLGLVLEVDTVNSQITVSREAVHAFSALSPTYVKLSVIMLKAERVGTPGPHQLGMDKIGSSLVRKNEKVRVFYHNFSEPIANKDLTFFVGHLY